MILFYLSPQIITKTSEQDIQTEFMEKNKYQTEFFRSCAFR